MQKGLFLASQLSNKPDKWLRENKGKYKGKSCVLLGAGQSLDDFHFEDLSGLFTMGVNSAMLFSGVRLNFFMSISKIFYRGYTSEIESLVCDRKFLPRFMRDDIEDAQNISWINEIPYGRHKDFAPERPLLYSNRPDKYMFLGGSVIGNAIQILDYIGFDRIVLLGIDHDWGLDESQFGIEGLWVPTKDVSEKYKIRDNYSKSGEKMHIDMLGAERAYNLAYEALKKKGKTLVNASSYTKLTTIPRTQWSQVLPELQREAEISE